MAGSVVADDQFPMVVALCPHTVNSFVEQSRVTLPGRCNDGDEGAISEPPALDRLLGMRLRRGPVEAVPIFVVGFDRDAGGACDLGQPRLNPLQDLP